ncbi:DIT2-1 [Scenedesmus sp. PABB004]|nr:DIT2-1 [Scenedesmus sp. PABB004]
MAALMQSRARALCSRQAAAPRAALLQRPAGCVAAPARRQQPAPACALPALGGRGGAAARGCRRPLRVAANAAGAAMPAGGAPAAPAAAPLQGMKLGPAAIAVAFGCAVKFLLPAPAAITPEAWTLFSIFLSTILGLVLQPLPVGAWAFVSLCAVVASGALPFAKALGAMTSEVIWLIVISFFFAKGFEKTGLGERIANVFVAAMGRSTLGLAYGLSIAELFLSPALPSTTARAGGIFVPIIKFLSKSVGGDPETGGRKKMGAFLMQSQLQQSSYSSALFLTSGAQNLLCLQIAAELGVVVPDAFTTWFVGCLPPALLGMAITPILLFKLFPPEVKETPEAPALAKANLARMGPMSAAEKITLATISGAVVLWMTGDAIGCPAVLAAMLALATLLVTGVLTWRDCLEYSPAWDTLIWFAILISMSNGLSESGLISTFAGMVGAQLNSLNLGWQPVFFILHAAFFALHYLFASQTAHIGALYAAFLAMMLASGCPGLLSALSLAYNGNLFGGITHFASGQAAIYYGSGFNSLSEFFVYGAIFGFLSLAITLGAGWPWWKLLGWF